MQMDEETMIVIEKQSALLFGIFKSLESFRLALYGETPHEENFFLRIAGN